MNITKISPNFSVTGQISGADVDNFERACQDLPGPILAYCQTGTRSVMLWALVQAKSRDVEAILSATKSAGYDLTGMRPRLLGRQ